MDVKSFSSASPSLQKIKDWSISHPFPARSDIDQPGFEIARTKPEEDSLLEAVAFSAEYAPLIAIASSVGFLMLCYVCVKFLNGVGDLEDTTPLNHTPPRWRRLFPATACLILKGDKESETRFNYGSTKVAGNDLEQSER